MADSLYLSLWFADFGSDNMFVRAAAVMGQFPFSKALPGITAIALHPVSWNEPTILEQRYRGGISPADALAVAKDLAHEDHAYVFEANWDLWSPVEKEWILRPSPVRIIVRGEEFEESEAKERGDIEIDFGLDIPFLHEELELSSELESRVRANTQLLVDFINHIEKSAGTSARLLWSESDENLAQKLISRLQKVQ